MRSASIIITSYNYGRFLGACIDSSLGQTHPNVEVIVVDDGSRDDSREIIRRYGSVIVPILKENAGQGSSFNVGFRASKGDVILFVDSDDILAPAAAETAARLMEEGTVKAHWPLWILDALGEPTGRIHPLRPVADGDLREEALATCPVYYSWPPTTGNAWSRRFLEQVLPMPEAEYRVAPDYYLCALAPLLGRIRGVPHPLGYWRIHAGNNGAREKGEAAAATSYRRSEFTLRLVWERCRAMGLAADLDVWRRHCYEHRLYLAMQDVKAVVPSGQPFLLADEGQWGSDVVLGERHARPFLEHEGQYWGPPPDDPTAIRELERMRQAGVIISGFGVARVLVAGTFSGVCPVFARALSVHAGKRPGHYLWVSLLS